MMPSFWATKLSARAVTDWMETVGLWAVRSKAGIASLLVSASICRAALLALTMASAVTPDLTDCWSMPSWAMDSFMVGMVLRRSMPSFWRMSEDTLTILRICGVVAQAT